jgi:hypothetical protein
MGAHASDGSLDPTPTRPPVTVIPLIPLAPILPDIRKKPKVPIVRHPITSIESRLQPARRARNRSTIRLE